MIVLGLVESDDFCFLSLLFSAFYPYSLGALVL